MTAYFTPTGTAQKDILDSDKRETERRAAHRQVPGGARGRARRARAHQRGRRKFPYANCIYRTQVYSSTPQLINHSSSNSYQTFFYQTRLLRTSIRRCRREAMRVSPRTIYIVRGSTLACTRIKLVRGLLGAINIIKFLYPVE